MRRVLPLVLVFVSVALDLGVIGTLKEFYVFPFFTLLLVIYATHYRSFYEALFVAAAGGFVLDSFSSIFGLNMAAFFAVAWVLHIFIAHPGKPSLAPLLVVSSLTVLVLSIISVAVNLELPFTFKSFIIALPPAAYTAFAAAVTYPLWNKIFEIIGYFETTVKLPGKTF